MLRGPGIDSTCYGTGKDGRVDFDMTTESPGLTQDLDGTSITIGNASALRGFYPNGFRMCATRSIHFIGSVNVSVSGENGTSGNSGGSGGTGGPSETVGVLGRGGKGGNGSNGSDGGPTEGESLIGLGGNGGTADGTGGGQITWAVYYGTPLSRQMLNLFGFTLGYTSASETAGAIYALNGGAGGRGGIASENGTGGGGGGGGGVIWISAPTVIIDPGVTVDLYCNGGNGGMGNLNASGGGGGGGGLIILRIGRLIKGEGALLRANVVGGPGGTSGGGGLGVTGGAGSAGRVLVFVDEDELFYDTVTGGGGVTVVTS
jgi:hypothetical protein